MENGPVLSRTLDLIKRPSKGCWSKSISEPCDYEVELRSDPGKGRLSAWENDIIDEVYREHGSWTAFRLVQYTHKLPEWKKLAAKPKKGEREPFEIVDILKAEKRPAAQIKIQLSEIKHERKMRALLR